MTESTAKFVLKHVLAASDALGDDYDTSFELSCCIFSIAQEAYPELKNADFVLMSQVRAKLAETEAAEEAKKQQAAKKEKECYDQLIGKIEEAAKAYKEYIYAYAPGSFEMHQFCDDYCDQNNLDNDFYWLGMELLAYYRNRPLFRADIEQSTPASVIYAAFGIEV